MAEFFANNLSTIIISMVIAAVVVLIIRGMIKDKKSGNGTCGCGCAGCPSMGVCQAKISKKQ